MKLQTLPQRFLSHVEIVHRPGERDLADQFLELLGMTTEDAMGGRFMLTKVESASFEPAAFFNFFGGSEVHAEQWAFESALEDAIRQGPLGESFAAWQQRLDRDPTSGMHTGIHFSSVEAWEAAVERLARLDETHPQLAGRARLASVHRPEDPDAVAPFFQAFVWTDILSAGSLAIGQRFELSSFPDGLAEAAEAGR
jgi:hypothetical protein